MINWLQKEWSNLASKYTKDDHLVGALWFDIEKNYSESVRHYHNLKHIYNMLIQSEKIKNLIEDFEMLQFSIWYHDIVYRPTRKDNEEKSALSAKNSLRKFSFDEKRIECVNDLIISTKKHELILYENNDNAYMLDLDLSILGTDWDVYKKYVENIRKEYKIYPNFMYNPGRKKVLQQFLNREALYFSEEFSIKYENQARENIERELERL
ncbi:HD domain-containing protein [Hanstruepera flava]|uniref:HD domain-containing protein n=1 Tax=Hanstruepera flava TaxID=2930218 RepID=UPI0020284128|nr:hypothetical protein [Hanstruepera flava]